MSGRSGPRDGGGASPPDGGAVVWPLAALAAIGLVTVAWWALALWPLPSGAELLARTWAVCFDTGEDGLPGITGWMLLVGQPLSMVGLLIVVWGGAVRRSLARAAASPVGRAALLATVAGVVLGVAAASLRVAAVLEAREAGLPEAVWSVDAHPRLDRAAPPLALVDQHGEAFDRATLVGRPVLVTFAFGHCTSICPLVVDHARRARDRVTGARVPLLVVTLDPWRDTPPRLPGLAERWGLGADDRVLGGVEAVEAALDAWGVPRTRDRRTGDVEHPPLVYLLDASGRIAFQTTASADGVEGLIRRLIEEG